jgi:hypothetical protein
MVSNSFESAGDSKLFDFSASYKSIDLMLICAVFELGKKLKTI